MTTPRGRTVVGLATGLLAAGRLLALGELTMIGTMLLALLGLGFAITTFQRRASIVCERRVVPSRTSAGAPLRVELRIRGSARGPLLLEDQLPSQLAGPARVAVPSLGRDERRLRYQVVANRRGAFRVGPMHVLHTDPFGFFVRRREVPGSVTAIVHPTFERLQTVPHDVRRAGGVRRSPLLGTGDEFFALRAYQEGDDVRKVHWPSSLKRGEIVVRQDELLAQPGVLVVLDSCAVKHRGDSIEAAISACASVGTLAIAAGMTLEIVSASGSLLKTRRPDPDELLDGLALLEASAAHDMGATTVQVLARRPSFSTLVVITPGFSPREVGIVADAAARASGGLVVQIAAGTFAGHRDVPKHAGDLARLALPVLALRAGASFRELWEAGIRGVSVA